MGHRILMMAAIVQNFFKKYKFTEVKKIVLHITCSVSRGLYISDYQLLGVGQQCGKMSLYSCPVCLAFWQPLFGHCDEIDEMDAGADGPLD